MGPIFSFFWLPNGELPNEFWDSCVEALFSKKAAARKQTVLRKTCPECPVNTSYKDWPAMTTGIISFPTLLVF